MKIYANILPASIVKSRLNPIFFILFLMGYLFVGCQITGTESKEATGNPECPVAMGVGPDPPANCYFWHNMYPSWSPDGRYIASIAPMEVEDGFTIPALFIYELSSGRKMQLLDWVDNKSSQAWSPDGEWLTFSMGAQIYKIRANGSDLTRITKNDDRAYFDPAWSPDGEWIVYSDGSVGGKFGIWIMNPDGSNSLWIAPRKGAHPNWMNDHTIFTTRSIRAEYIDYRFFVWNPFTNSEPDTLNSREDAINTRQRYNSMSSSIVFQSQKDGDIDIWKINDDGTGLQRLTFNGGAHPAWSPDGSTIAYVNIDYFEGKGKIWLMDPDGTNRRPMR